MRKHFFFALAALCVAGTAGLQFGCSKNSGPSGPALPAKVQTYAVTTNVLNPLGSSQGGATVSLVNPPYPNGTYADQPFEVTTDSVGNATIQAPLGSQTITAKIGTLFQASTTVNVVASSTPLVAPQLRLAQNSSLKVLVVLADCENLEDVLKNVGFTIFDQVYIDSLRDRATADSVGTLTFLKKYNYVFSDCHCSTEQGSEYAVLSRVYGRFVTAGGKMYGGHYNYFHLQRIWSPNYTKSWKGTTVGNDSIQVLNRALASAAGYTVSAWSSGLSYYDMFTDIPATSTVYAILKNSSPQGAVIVVNVVGSGKYVWTNYHNQDVGTDPRLLKLIQFFLWSM
ncbi:MAG TPA: hypothetical protein VMF59_12195 [Bacteroidota bacterium]|nr:hypothetical protein [Bacteroidota bacterium]